MHVAAFIPFFLAVQLPIEDGAWPYGPEYIFTVHMNVTGIPECPRRAACGDPFGFRITSRLHCIPRGNDTLTCSLRYVDGFDFGMIGEDAKVIERRKNVSDKPIELIFDEEGIENIITSQLTQLYDLNILKMVVEQLHLGNDFNDVKGDAYEGKTVSTVGNCNVTFDVHRSEAEDLAARFRRGFRLKLLPWRLRLTSTETIVIDKMTNLNDCICYADSYFRKYGDTIIYEHLQADLETMVSQMKISETSFSSSTTRQGRSFANHKTHNILEITEITLDDIQPAAKYPPDIVKPGVTKLLANLEIRSISADRDY